MVMDIQSLSTTQIIEHLNTISHELGKVIGWEEAADELRQRAGRYYVDDFEELAEASKNLSKDFFLKKTQKRKEFDAEYAELRAKLWGELDRRFNLSAVTKRDE